jgi:hypothetical protein
MVDTRGGTSARTEQGGRGEKGDDIYRRDVRERKQEKQNLIMILKENGMVG